ncbi:MAG TPA: hypothetical protein VK745_11635 [Polyangiaceae bacterium]|nr:hypothetical protein [Polyangiaceae bacterium]
MHSACPALQHSVRLSILALLGVLVVAVLCACSGKESHEGAGGAPGKGVYVQLSWGADRRVSGHRVHVVDQHIACNQCHELNASSVGVVSPIRCANCHAARATIEHAARLAEQRFGPGVHADCVNCHAFTNLSSPADTLDGGVLEPYGPGNCVRCHAQAQGQIPAVTVHASVACLNCHRPHQDQKPVSADCAGCHHDIQTAHAALGKSPNGVCTTCHAHQHAPASAALASCVECHSKTQPIVPASALFAGGHTQCVGCHQPHAFESSKAVDCRSCHANVVVFAAARVPEHARCTSCHSPHDVRSDPGAACVKCHSNVHSDHPERSGHGACVTCHEPHPAVEQAHAQARACNGCHRVAESDHDVHGGAPCQSCHVPHHFEIALAEHVACQSCHQKELTLTATRVGHAACESCHQGLPHKPSGVGTACVTCHADARRDVRVGHQLCTGCHEPHAGGIATACKTCHVQEFASAPVGHQLCTNCHEPHSGSTARVQCASCHAVQAASPHGKITTGCATCHRPHGPGGIASMPACTSCHALATLPGLHAQAQHHDCARCHGGHADAPDAARSACLSCHTDRKKHFPDAPRCANCHLFESADRPAKGATEH